MLIECFAQRLLNPFRGAMHTVKYDVAEAVTVDGQAAPGERPLGLPYRAQPLQERVTLPGTRDQPAD